MLCNNNFPLIFGSFINAICAFTEIKFTIKIYFYVHKGGPQED